MPMHDKRIWCWLAISIKKPFVSESLHFKLYSLGDLWRWQFKYSWRNAGYLTFCSGLKMHLLFHKVEFEKHPHGKLETFVWFFFNEKFQKLLFVNHVVYGGLVLLWTQVNLKQKEGFSKKSTCPEIANFLFWKSSFSLCYFSFVTSALKHSINKKKLQV